MKIFFLMMIVVFLQVDFLNAEECKDYPDMEATPQMCNMMPNMCACKRFFELAKPQLNRRRIDKPAPFPDKPPGIESFNTQGYFIGKERVEDYFDKKIKKLEKNATIRHYDLVFDQFYDKDFDYLFTNLHYPEVTTIPSHPLESPYLFFVEGEIAEITIYNKIKIPEEASQKKEFYKNLDNVSTAIHWHGLILENIEDGIPGITQPAIAPGETYTYRFKIRQNGTYWYHPHQGLQEQHVRGALVILPKNKSNEVAFLSESTQYQHDRVIFLSDLKGEDPRATLARLPFKPENQDLECRNYSDIMTAFSTEGGINQVWSNVKGMGMVAMDTEDVCYDKYFVNGRPRGEDLKIQPGERVRLRIQNGSASTYFTLDYANNIQLKPEERLFMKVIAKDGQYVKPVEVDEILVGMGESYDVLIEVPEGNKSYELRIKSISDGRNYDDPKDEKKKDRLLKYYFGHGAKGSTSYGEIVKARDVFAGYYLPKDRADNGKDIVRLNYDMLKAYKKEPIEKAPIDYINLEILGNMSTNYYWELRGAKKTKLVVKNTPIPYIEVEKNRRVHVTIENDMQKGMMNHPMHLHGHFFRLTKKADIESGKDLSESPLAHTVTVFPGGKLEFEFYTGEEDGFWMFHCHNLYHMANAMMIMFKYKDTQINPSIMSQSMGHGDDHPADHTTANAKDLSQMTHKGHGEHVFTQGRFDLSTQFIEGGFKSFIGADYLTFDFEHKWSDRQKRQDRGLAAFNKCTEPNLCARFSFNYEKIKSDFESLTDDSSVTNRFYGGLGANWWPMNSDLLELAAQVHTDRTFRSWLASSIPVAPRTDLDFQFVCEGPTCGDLSYHTAIEYRYDRNFRFDPLICEYEDGEGICGVSINISFDEFDLNKSSKFLRRTFFPDKRPFGRSL